MRILVCVKQVPDTAEIKIDPQSGTLMREGVESIVNPFDGYALEMAARVKDSAAGASVTVISMGPQQAKKALTQCLSVGADKAYLVCGRGLGGADTLATSYALFKAIRHIEAGEGAFDLILCGRQAIDGDTAQTGPELAERLGCPQITCARELYIENGAARAVREADGSYEVWETPLPAVITVAKTDYEPRLPTAAAKMKAKRMDIPVLTAEDIGADPGKSGLKGSPTKVKRTFTMPRKSGGIIIRGRGAKEAAAMLAGMLGEAGAI